MHKSARYRYAAEAASDGIRYLLNAQSKDGFWRDYSLPPGSSEGWSTGWVGWALASVRGWAYLDQVDPALERAALAMCGAVRHGGWGYNKSSEPDGDSTAWALRFLTSMGAAFGQSAVDCLEAYLDPGGAAHTFRGSSAGSWGCSHPDVTPVVGLALQAAGASPERLAEVRSAVLRAKVHQSGWTAFWWASSVYPTAWSAIFLRGNGGIPTNVAYDLRCMVETWPANRGAFDNALGLLLAGALGMYQEDFALMLVDDLVRQSEGAAGWKGSSELLVPPRFSGAAATPLPHRDNRGLMTTAIACRALVEWLCTSHLLTDRGIRRGGRFVAFDSIA